MKITFENKYAITKHYRTLDVEDGPIIPAGDTFYDGVTMTVDKIKIEWVEGQKALSVRVVGKIIATDGTESGQTYEQGFTRKRGIPEWLEKVIEENHLFV